MKKKRKKILLVIRTHRITSPNFSVYHTALLAIVIMLFIASLVLIYLITGGLYLLTTFLQFRVSPPLASGSHKSDLFFCELVSFLKKKSTYKWILLFLKFKVVYLFCLFFARCLSCLWVAWLLCVTCAFERLSFQRGFELYSGCVGSFPLKIKHQSQEISLKMLQYFVGDNCGRTL